MTALRQMPLRSRLLWLVGVALLPVVLFAVFGLLALGRQQQDQARKALVERARAMASAVDLELQGSVAALEVLALSRSLDAGDLRRFHADARAAAGARATWDGILLTDLGGKWLLSTRIPYGSPMPGRGAVVEAESFASIVATGQPVIGNIARGPGGRYLFPVRVAVTRGGEPRYILTALVDPAAMLRILERQKVPPQSLSTIFDGRLSIVARSRDHARYAGMPLSDSLRAMMGDAGEGWGLARTRDGDEVYTAFSRAGHRAWGVALGVERIAVELPIWRSYALSGAGILLSLALGALAALWLARRIAGPIERLRLAAQALGRGAVPEDPPAAIPEIDEVARALAAAGRELRESEERLRQLNASLEARVAERTAQLRHANAELQAANEQLESFSYSVSHDLRAPLRAVDGYTGLVLREHGAALPAQARERLQTVSASARRMARLIDALLAFSRLARQQVSRQRVDVGALVGECLRELRGERAVEVVAGELPACQADPQLLRQVLMNLIGNAFKYSARAEAPRVEIGWRREDAEDVYYVRDNGVGFDMRHAGKLFGVFERLHAEEEFEGTGAGLAIVQRIVQRHGGRVWAQAEPGKGATFSFTLGGAAAA